MIELPDIEPTEADTVEAFERLYALCATRDLDRPTYEAAVMAASDLALFSKPAALSDCHLTSELLLGVYCSGKIGRWPDHGGVIDDLGGYWTPAMFEAGLRLLALFAGEAKRLSEAA